ncbi:molecular chaperone Hsp90 [Actinomycetospora sp. NBRC 106375]|uniref:sacsin N-terminal ATP-binding-like domain-containing protein n=1 Tax=Actinomycetospora sp. NBRC 106375 TaxID=3032207 RepID=UPI0024A4003A|nr:ATP-binding protein [Actinomycetospora sp. NBRC 106375]GLZ45576.1 molecular chaperone Hsp90 [Actinomycetospora sp. NBRC 106375]
MTQGDTADVAPDPFGTAALRRAVLDAWTASPARFREDANAEEDLLRGGYRDRWFVELAQNAADAAERAGTTTVLRVRVDDGVLGVAGSGAPLDADGVAGLASLRASAKRGTGGVGRFGVGFAAVTVVSDAPRVVTRTADGATAGVVFDRARTARAIADTGVGALAEELARRDGAAPALRLAWPTEPDEPAPPAGTDTEVRLPLRPGLDPAALLATAAAQAPDLLLALPALHAVDLPDGVVARVEESDAVVVGDRRWHVAHAEGTVPAELLADLAVEDRARPGWRVTWAEPGGGVVIDAEHPDVLHAPTPTDEHTTLPARLLATVPLDPDRRHVRAGPVTEHVLAAAAARYPDLVRARPGVERPALVPRPALPASAVDASLRDGVLAALRTTPWLPPAVAGDDLAPAAAQVLDLDPTGPPAVLAALAEQLAPVLPGLLDAALAEPRHAAALAAVGVGRVGPATLVEALAGVDRPVAWWRSLLAGLAALPALATPAAREELAGLPVPLADGRLVHSARGVLLPGDDTGLADRLAAAGVPGLRVAAPGLDDDPGARDLLTALGARPVDGSALLADPALREAVDRSLDDAEAGADREGLDALAALVLDLVARGAQADRDLGALALPDLGATYRRADELVLPDGVLRGLVDPDGPLGVLDPSVAAAHPRHALTALGVLDGFAVLRDEAPTGPDHDLDDEELWWAEEMDPDPEQVLEPAPLVAVRDLDLVADDRWDAAWPVLAGDREVREALGGARPVEAAGDDGPRPYTAWWLGRHGRLGGRPPTAWRLPGAAAVAGLYDPVPDDVAAALDPAFLAAVGVRTRPRVAGADDATDLLARLADPARAVPAAIAATAHAALAEAVAAGRVTVADVEPPDRVRVADGTVRDADPGGRREVPPAVLDHAQLAGVLPASVLVLPGPGDPAVLADLMDLAPASERVRVSLREGGRAVAWERIPAVVAWAAALGHAVPEGELVLHERLRVLVVDDERGGAPEEHTPGVWVADGVVHADDPLKGLLAALSG